MNYYTYALIDPRVGLPFYIGKGTKDRCYRHLMPYMRKTKTLKNYVINKIESLGLSIKVFISKPLSEEEAFEMEELLISEYGRRDGNTGVLVNHTNGGEGSSGYKHSNESLKKISKSQKGKVISEERKQELRDLFLSEDSPVKKPEAIAKRSGENHWTAKKENPCKGRKLWSEEDKKKIAERSRNQKRQPTSEETKEKLRQAHLGRKVSDTSKFHWERKKTTCPHCEKEGSVGNMKRWHFDNCKDKS